MYTERQISQSCKSTWKDDWLDSLMGRCMVSSSKDADLRHQPLLCKGYRFLFFSKLKYIKQILVEEMQREM